MNKNLTIYKKYEHIILKNENNNIKPKTLTDNKHTYLVNVFDEYDYKEFFIFSHRNNNPNKRDVIFIIQE